jgi:hypothetical protein
LTSWKKKRPALFYPKTFVAEALKSFFWTK